MSKAGGQDRVRLPFPGPDGDYGASEITKVTSDDVEFYISQSATRSSSIASAMDSLAPARPERIAGDVGLGGGTGEHQDGVRPASIPATASVSIRSPTMTVVSGAPRCGWARCAEHHPRFRFADEIRLRPVALVIMAATEPVTAAGPAPDGARSRRGIGGDRPKAPSRRGRTALVITSNRVRPGLTEMRRNPEFGVRSRCGDLVERGGETGFADDARPPGAGRRSRNAAVARAESRWLPQALGRTGWARQPDRAG